MLDYGRKIWYNEQALASVSQACSCSSVDRAPASGAGCRAFDSHHGHYTLIRMVEKLKVKYGSIIIICVLAVVIVVAFIPTQKVNDTKMKKVIVGNEHIDENVTKEAEVIKKESSTMAQTTGKTFVRNGNAEVNRLVENYYEALLTGEEEVLQKYTDKVDKVPDAIKKLYVNGVEEVTDINCYTMAGMLNNTYITVVTSNLHLKGFEQTVPLLQYLYICTDASNNLYIMSDEPGDDVLSYNELMYKSSSISDVIAKNASEYDEKLANDEELAAFIAECTTGLEN